MVPICSIDERGKIIKANYEMATVLINLAWKDGIQNMMMQKGLTEGKLRRCSPRDPRLRVQIWLRSMDFFRT